MKRILTGNYSQTASGRLSYEIFNASPEIIDEVGNILVERFRCSPLTRKIAGFDEVIAGCTHGKIELMVGWDNWSGFYLFSDSPEGEHLVKEVGEHLNAVIGNREFEKFVHDW